jgi:iron complex transport system substrate-binding protein
LREVLDSVLTLGQATGHSKRAQQLVEELRARLDGIVDAVAGQARPQVSVLEWTAPTFTGGHSVPDMVRAAGGEPVLGRPGQRSERTSPAQIAACWPDVVVVAPCGYRLPGAVELARDAVNAGSLPAGVPVWAVDADAAFVRPGPRLVDGVEALAAIAHPGALPARPELAARL